MTILYPWMIVPLFWASWIEQQQKPYTTNHYKMIVQNIIIEIEDSENEDELFWNDPDLDWKEENNSCC